MAEERRPLGAIFDAAEREHEEARTDDGDLPGIHNGRARAWSSSSDVEPWSEPVEFLATDEHGHGPELCEDQLPAAIFPFVKDAAARMGVDPCSVALATLVALSSVADDAWRLQPKQYDDTWTEAPRLWGAIVGDPSILKSPVIQTCTEPLDRLDAESRQRYASDMRKYLQDVAATKAADGEAEETPRPPRLDRHLVEGTTTEALSEILRTDADAKYRAPSGKVLIRQDEMSEWIASFDSYRSGGKGGSDRGAYLRLYNGGRYTIDRIGRGSFAIPNWSGCILCGIQPEPIRRIAQSAADDGLLQRFIYSVSGRQYDGKDRRPDHEARRRYAALFSTLLGLHPPLKYASGLDDALGAVQAVVLHADAHRHRLAINNLAQAMAGMPDTSNRLKAAFGKWPGLFARIALTFHLIEIADARARNLGTPVLTVLSEETARRAANYMRYFVLPHLLRAEAVMFSTALTSHAQWIAGHILAKGELRIALRDVVQAYGPLRAPESRRELLEVMESLVTVGWLQQEEQRNPSRPPTAWRVNPAVGIKFAGRADKERSARSKAQVRLAQAVAELRQEKAKVV